MKQEDFSLALNALLPGCDPEAASKWAEFAAECAEEGQFAYFIPTEHNAAVEKWLDAAFAGLCAVKREYGEDIASEVAGLSCRRCALYPGEMLPAAEVLKSGGDAERISSMIASDKLEADEPFFFDLPDGAALTAAGPEIHISQSGVTCGLFQKRTEPGFVLADGAVLLESERDSFGRYRGGTGMDGMYLQTGKLYAPVRDGDGQITAFREVKPVTAREREAAFLSGRNDAFAIYRMKYAPAPEGCVPLARLQRSGESPLRGNYALIHIAPLEPGADPHKVMDAYRSDAMKPGDIAAFKQGGTVTCWYMDRLANSEIPGLLGKYLAASEMQTEQNYNKIDGVINNEPPKTSLSDILRQYKEQSSKRTSPPPDKPHGQER